MSVRPRRCYAQRPERDFDASSGRRRGTHWPSRTRGSRRTLWPGTAGGSRRTRCPSTASSSSCTRCSSRTSRALVMMARMMMAVMPLVLTHFFLLLRGRTLGLRGRRRRHRRRRFRGCGRLRKGGRGKCTGKQRRSQHGYRTLHLSLLFTFLEALKRASSTDSLGHCRAIAQKRRNLNQITAFDRPIRSPL